MMRPINDITLISLSRYKRARSSINPNHSSPSQAKPSAFYLLPLSYLNLFSIIYFVFFLWSLRITRLLSKGVALFVLGFSFPEGRVTGSVHSKSSIRSIGMWYSDPFELTNLDSDGFFLPISHRFIALRNFES